MNRLDFVRTRDNASIAAAALMGGLFILVILAVFPATSIAASFATSDGIDGAGFDGTTLGPVDRVLEPSVEFVDANDLFGPGTTDVQIDGSLDLCILVGSSTTCDLTGQDPAEEPFVGDPGPISFLVTITIADINNENIDPNGFTLVLRDLAPNVDDPSFGCVSNDCPDYDRSFVTIDDSYAALPTLDLRGFDFDPTHGINGFDPFIVLKDDSDPADIRYYLAWNVVLGQSVTFKFDLEQGQVLFDLPHFEFSAIPIPEPGMALLIGLGLAGLSLSGRREA